MMIDVTFVFQSLKVTNFGAKSAKLPGYSQLVTPKNRLKWCDESTVVYSGVVTS